MSGIGRVVWALHYLNYNLLPSQMVKKKNWKIKWINIALFTAQYHSMLEKCGVEKKIIERTENGFFKITEDQKKDTAFLQVNQFNWRVKALSCKRDLSFVRSSPTKLKFTRLKFDVARNVKPHWFQFLKEVTLYSVETRKTQKKWLCMMWKPPFFFFF